jgi:hypothetical protein
MFALAGMRFYIMAELITIKKKIDKLLDVYTKHKDDPQAKAQIETKLKEKQQELMNWYEVHGSN